MSNNGSSILSAYIARDGVVLAEVRRPIHEEYSDYVTQAATALQQKKATPGWEFSLPPIQSLMKSPFKLKGTKFHIQDYIPADEDEYEDGDIFVQQQEGGLCIWSIGCIYDANSLPKQKPMTVPKTIQSFVSHVERASKSFRQEDDEWKTASGYLPLQDQFAPTLLSIMDNLDWYDQRYAIEQEIDRLKDIMHQNINNILERGEKAEDMLQKAEELENQAHAFKRRTKDLKKKMKRKHLMVQAAYGATAATAVTVAVAVPCALFI